MSQANDHVVAPNAENAHSENEVANNLFRVEAIRQIADAQYGEILLTHSIRHTWIAWVSACFVAGILGFFILFSTTKKEQSVGVLVPTHGLLKISTPQDGVIARCLVGEGQIVSKGDDLFIVSSELSSTNNENTRNKISSLLRARIESINKEFNQLSTQANNRKSTLLKQIDSLKNELSLVGGQIEIQKRKVALAEETQNRFRELQKANYISAAQVRDKLSEYLDQQQRLAELQRGRALTLREMETSKSNLADLRIQEMRDMESARRSLATVEQELADSEGRREIAIKAPIDGVVSGVTVDAGQSIQSGQKLTTLLPSNSELEAEIYLSAKSIGFVKTGMLVQLRYDAFPFQKFGQHPAEVREISLAAMQPEDLPVPSVALTLNPDKEQVYRARLRLIKQSIPADGKVIPLKPGMLLHASIQLEKRRLYEWIVDPMTSITSN